MMNNIMKNIYWAALNLVPGIGSKTLRQLYKYFQNAEVVWNMPTKDLVDSKCLQGKTLSELIEFRQKISIEKLAEKLKYYKIHICTELDENYPEQLKSIFNPPFMLYYQGILPQTEKCIGIVGARTPTVYGKQIAQKMAEELVQYDFVVVSGAARGIDTKAHEGALTKGKTIAVLGCGLDIAYPPENKQLLQKIAQNGAVISEYPLGTLPKPGNFPARNRIITGLSKGILVVEAAKKSGSLITAEFALSEGRDVFAVPGNIYSAKSEGCHNLIKQGAKLVTKVQDIIEEYTLVEQNNSKIEQDTQLSLEYTKSMTEEEKLIYENLSITEPKCIDEIIYKLRMNVSNISFVLLQMKLKGLVKETSPNFYIRAIRECFE